MAARDFPLLLQTDSYGIFHDLCQYIKIPLLEIRLPNRLTLKNLIGKSYLESHMLRNVVKMHMTDIHIVSTFATAGRENI